jgi:NAD(P)-dependent dehydrogenase (short-subunit alcohol dehydrogenase family)
MMKDHGTSARRTVVMTGGTNGIGAAALQRLAHEPRTRVIVGARGTGRKVPGGVEVLGLDLASLDSVRAFAAEVVDALDGAPIDALVLNAGTQASDLKGRTADGFETTFGINHLAHYLLARLLAPRLADGGRLVITTSDTHDPAVTPLGPKSLDPAALAHPTGGGFGSGMRAYASSKLCNLLTARYLANSPDLAERSITVVAFNPGLTVGTNLGGRSPRTQRIFAALVVPIFGIVGRIKPEYSAGRPERAGEVLSGLATGTLTPPTGKVYASIVRGELTYPSPSTLALDDTKRDELWERSAEMVGV